MSFLPSMVAAGPGGFLQPLAPIAGSLALSALVALLPLLVVFLLLGVAKTQAYVAALAGLGTARLVAVVGYGMPASLALLSATEGGGSDTSANALFAKLQATAGSHAGINESLLVSANTTGGVVGKMISPQNLTIAASAAGLDGQESAILRRVLPWSLGLLDFLCLLVLLQSTPVLGWMLP